MTKRTPSDKPLTPAAYQQLAMRTASPFGNQRDQLIAAALGLNGEAGEVADIIKKYCFHNHMLDTDHLIAELGDVLWYVALACQALDITMDTVMRKNIAKLARRYPEGFDADRSIHREEQP
jgi:NTP pyrophosphatase (non-canonical NTP hydrolase)